MVKKKRSTSICLLLTIIWFQVFPCKCLARYSESRIESELSLACIHACCDVHPYARSPTPINNIPAGIPQKCQKCLVACASLVNDNRAPTESLRIGFDSGFNKSDQFVTAISTERADQISNVAYAWQPSDLLIHQLQV
jgi:hypothetical protein